MFTFQFRCAPGNCMTTGRITQPPCQANASPRTACHTQLDSASLNAIHFWGWKLRKVSYTLLNGFRLQWPPSYCFESPTPFRPTLCPEGHAPPSWTRHRYDTLLRKTSTNRSSHISHHSQFPRQWDMESRRSRFSGADVCLSRALSSLKGYKSEEQASDVCIPI